MKAKKTTFLFLLVLLSLCYQSCEVLRNFFGKKPTPPNEYVYRIDLASRSFTPQPGVSTQLLEEATQAYQQGKQYIHFYAQRDSIPAIKKWADWKTDFEWAAHIEQGTYVLRARLQKDMIAKFRTIRTAFNASALFSIDPRDRITQKLLKQDYFDWSFNEENKLIKITILFFPNTSAESIENVLEQYNKGESEPIEIGRSFWSIQVSPQDIAPLTLIDFVHYVEEGPMPALPLMAIARNNLGVNAVQNINTGQIPPTYLGLSGKNVRLSNGEGLDGNHDDFWNHNSSGARTTPRWLGCSGGGVHGAMTAGIMLGNGWNSSNINGVPYQFRGIAPEAIYDCESNEPDVANRSFAETNGNYSIHARDVDAKIRGEGNSNFHTYVHAVANQGITPQYYGEKGYYSVYSPFKNSIVVANISDVNYRWLESSIGPTFDGRLKPDISAPGGTSWPLDLSEVEFDLDYVKLKLLGNQTTEWNFNASAPNWTGGWGDHSWYGKGDANKPCLQINESGITGIRAPFTSGPYGGCGSGPWKCLPKLGTITAPNASTPLNINSSPADEIEIRYRLTSVPDWIHTNSIVGLLYESPNSGGWKSTNFNVIADGQWHTSTISLGSDPEWTSLTGINFLGFGLWSLTSMPVPFYGTDGYFGASGSSSAAPIVTGSIALLLEQMVNLYSITLGDHSPSPFDFSNPNIGTPLSSTWRGLLCHTADDLAYIPSVKDNINPDIGVPTFYHKGPDLVTGYGVINVEEAVRLVQADKANRLQNKKPYIFEREIDLNQGTHIYTIDVPQNQTHPLKITLAWDDAPGNPSVACVVNQLKINLNIQVFSPSGKRYDPWSIVQPYIAQSPSNYPCNVEPEPITASGIKPARQDQPNNHDNLEQVYIEFPEPGTWQIFVMPISIANPPQVNTPPYKYSLITGTPSKPANNLQNGKVVFVSDRVSPDQIFLKTVGSPNPPVQLTSGNNFPSVHPIWSPNGQYIAYVTQDVLMNFPNSTVTNVLVIMDNNGVARFKYYAIDSPTGVPILAYPNWSPDGKKIVFNFFKEGQNMMNLGVIEFNTAYDFNNYNVDIVLSQPGFSPGDPCFSKDGNHIYFEGHDQSGTTEIYRIPSKGGLPFKIHNTGAINRAFHVDISPDGKRMLFNSEMWKVDPLNYLDEEVVEYGILTGVDKRITFESGNQQAFYALNGSGEMILESSTFPAGKKDLFLFENGVRVKLDINDPNNVYSDRGASWWKN